MKREKKSVSIWKLSFSLFFMSFLFIGMVSVGFGETDKVKIGLKNNGNSEQYDVTYDNLGNVKEVIRTNGGPLVEGNDVTIYFKDEYGLNKDEVSYNVFERTKDIEDTHIIQSDGTKTTAKIKNDVLERTDISADNSETIVSQYINGQFLPIRESVSSDNYNSELVYKRDTNGGIISTSLDEKDGIKEIVNYKNGEVESVKYQDTALIVLGVKELTVTQEGDMKKIVYDDSKEVYQNSNGEVFNDLEGTDRVDDVSSLPQLVQTSLDKLKTKENIQKLNIAPVVAVSTPIVVDDKSTTKTSTLDAAKKELTECIDENGNSKACEEKIRAYQSAYIDANPDEACIGTKNTVDGACIPDGIIGKQTREALGISTETVERTSTVTVEKTDYQICLDSKGEDDKCKTKGWIYDKETKGLYVSKKDEESGLSFLVPVGEDGDERTILTSKETIKLMNTYSTALKENPNLKIDDSGLTDSQKNILKLVSGDSSASLDGYDSEVLIALSEKKPTLNDKIAKKLVADNSAADLGTIYKDVKNQDLSDAMMSKALDKERGLNENYVGSEQNRDSYIENKNTVEAMCENNPDSCKQSLMNIAVDNGNENQILARDNVLKLDLTSGDVANLVSKAPLTPQAHREALTKANGVDCDSIIGSIWCGVTDKQNTKQNLLSGVANNNAETKQNYLVLPDGKIEIGGESKILGFYGKEVKPVTIECKGQTVNQCYTINKDQLQEYCNANKMTNPNTCKSFFEGELSKRASFDSKNKDAYNLEIYKNAANTLGISGCNSDLTSCKAAIDKEEERLCGTGNAVFASPDCRNIRAVKEKIEGDQQVEYNIALTSFISGILNPDPKALSAAKLLFGAEADYSKLGRFGQTFAAGICQAKIDGYLDKTIENSGSVTQYGCLDNPDYEEIDPSNPCVDVIVDLRAKRTQITPDNVTVISYSYYLKAPKEEGIKFILAGSYVINGRKEKFLILNATDVGEDSISTNLRSYDLEVKGATATNFKIGILALKKDKSIYTNVVTEIILAAIEAYLPESRGNTQGNEESTSSTNSASSTLTVDDMLNLANI